MDRRLVAVLLLAGVVAVAMGAAYVARPQPTISGKVKVVASFYPLAYMAEAIGGDGVEVTTLIPPGVEPHSYQPTVSDLVACSDADVIIYNGAGLDDWLRDSVLPSIDASGKLVVDSTANVTLFRNVAQAEVQEHGAYDPHTWVSPHEAYLQGRAIYEALVGRDPANTASYAAGWAALASRLAAMDQAYGTGLANTTRHVIFTTHDAFGYFGAAYAVEFIAPQGVSTESDASARDVARIIAQVKRERIPAVFLENVTDPRLLKRIGEETGTAIGGTLYSDALTERNGPAPTYVELMRHNARQLAAALAK